MIDLQHKKVIEVWQGMSLECDVTTVYGVPQFVHWIGTVGSLINTLHETYGVEHQYNVIWDRTLTAEAQCRVTLQNQNKTKSCALPCDLWTACTQFEQLKSFVFVYDQSRTLHPPQWRKWIEILAAAHSYLAENARYKVPRIGRS